MLLPVQTVCLCEVKWSVGSVVSLIHGCSTYSSGFVSLLDGDL